MPKWKKWDLGVRFGLDAYYVILLDFEGKYDETNIRYGDWVADGDRLCDNARDDLFIP